jgi:DNA-binding NtrC family response regulator
MSVNRLDACTPLDSRDDECGAPQGVRPPSAPYIRAMRVLLVLSEPDLLDGLTDYLLGSGFEVLPALEPNGGLATLAAGFRAEVALIDLSMDRAECSLLVAAVRAVWPGTRVIGMSDPAGCSPDIAAMVDEALQMPFRPADLVRVLESVDSAGLPAGE